ncbi:MAG: hypothetical protein ACLQED_10580 [Desulfobaccales bacterium]
MTTAGPRRRRGTSLAPPRGSPTGAAHAWRIFGPGRQPRGRDSYTLWP